MELGRLNPLLVQTRTELRQLVLIAGSQVDVRGVVVGRATVEVSVFNGRMASLNRLLREWEIAARDGVQVVLADLRLHDVLR